MRKGAAVFACFVALCLAGPTAAGAGGLQTGIIDPFTLGLGGFNPAAPGRVAEVGGTTVRVQLTWDGIAPASQPASWDPTNPNDSHYNQARWAGFQTLLDSVRAQGLDPLVFIVEAPAWAEGPGNRGSAPPGTFKPSRAGLADFVKAAVRRFPEVRFWQAWNEPNHNLFLNPQIDGRGRPYSPEFYRRMLNMFAGAVRSVDPTDLVVVGGLAPYGKYRGAVKRVAPLHFMREMFCLSGRLRANCRRKSQFDVWATHPYTWGAPTRHALNRDDVAMGDLPEMSRVLRAAIRARHVVNSHGKAKRRVPFWVTEISWDTRPADTDAVGMNLHARWTSEGLYRMWRAGVSRVYWFLIRDRPFPADLWQSGFFFCGDDLLVDEAACGSAALAGDDPKPRSLQAFRFPFVAFARRGVVSVWMRIPPGASGPVVVQRYLGNDRWKTIIRARNRGGGVFVRAWHSSRTTGYYRARVSGVPQPYSEAFSLKKAPSPYVSPFGCGGDSPC